MVDSFFSVAALALLGLNLFQLHWTGQLAKAWAQTAKEQQALIYSQEADPEDYSTQLELREAQLAEARARIDTLNGELTAADLSLNAARKNDHRDAKGRYAPAHDPYVSR